MLLIRFLICAGVLCAWAAVPRALTLEEAMDMAEGSLPGLKAADNRVGSTDSLYKASLSPYLPTLDAAASQEKRKQNSSSLDLSTYDVTLSYTLYDGGRRRADRNVARLNRDSEKEERARTLLDLQFDVKSAFFSTIARRDILQHRKLQVEDSRKDLEVARGRYELGVAKLSDVLQSSVRFEQSKFSLVEAEGELNKSMAQLNSLLGRSLESEYDLAGELESRVSMPDSERLGRAALQRPEIRQSEYAVEAARNLKTRQISEYLPVITAGASYNRSEATRFVSDLEDKAIGIRVTWNIFELGKLYRTRSAEFDLRVTRDNLEETIRRLLLELRLAYEDYVTASRNVDVAEEQLKQAEHNYAQTFGEYRIGKTDIIALVAAAIALSNAREQHTVSRLSVILARVLIERATGVERIESVE
ncbi:MAG: TolC family protein [Syntrophobacteraceae bacterium]|jgi:outer membrane protein TolC|nr:TolC family protein [Syntrophobacteraceae bacterium]MCU0588959.1 TolC family protein [Syntrophobacteraceae bacterium]